MQLVELKATASPCLDLFFTSEVKLNNSVGAKNLKEFSDHFGISLPFNDRISKTVRVQYFSYCNFDLNEIMVGMTLKPFQLFCYSNVDVAKSAKMSKRELIQK